MISMVMNDLNSAFVGGLKRALTVFVVSAALVFAPIHHSEAKMNDQIKEALIMLVVTIGVNYAAYKVAEKICEGGGGTYTAMFCIMAVMAAAQVVVTLITTVLLKKSDRETRCEGQDCFRGGGATTTTSTTLYDPNDPNGSTTSTTLETPPPPPGDNNEDIRALMNDAGLNPDAILKDANNTLRDLENKGYTYDPKTGIVTTPRGKINGSSMGSAAGMAAAGFSPQEIKAYEANKDTVDSAAKNEYDRILKALDADDMAGGGGGSFGSGSSNAGSGYKPLDYSKLFQQQNKKPDKPSVAGLTKQHGGDAIGVASDNLFKMVERRYDSERKQGGFINGDVKAPVSVPGSVGAGE